MFIKGMLSGCITPEGNIDAKFKEMKVVDALRPKHYSEIGAQPGQLEVLNTRKPDSGFFTPARLGAGAAIVIPDISVLKWTREPWVKKLEQKCGEFGPQGLLGLIRDLGAGGTFLCADVCAGVPTIADIRAGAFAEIVEVGVFKEDGWVEFQLPQQLKQLNSYQKIVADQQVLEWSRLNPALLPKYQANLKMLDIGQDQINETRAIISTEPENGSVEVILLAKIILPGTDWLLCDTEHVELPEKTFALKRKPTVICPRADKSPLMFSFGPEGLDIGSPVIPLSGESLELCINRKVESVLNSLGWLT